MKFRILWYLNHHCMAISTEICPFSCFSGCNVPPPTSSCIIFVTVWATSSQISWSLVHTWISNVLLSQVPAINNVWLGAVQKVCILQYVLTLAAIISVTVSSDEHHIWQAHRGHFGVLCDAARNSYYEKWPNSAYSKLLHWAHLAICSDFGSHYLSNRYSDEHHIWHAHREHFGVLCDTARNSYYEKWPNSAYSKLLPRFSCFSGSILRDSLFS